MEGRRLREGNRWKDILVRPVHNRLLAHKESQMQAHSSVGGIATREHKFTCPWLKTIASFILW